jgi:hypothetical protein
VIGKQTVASLRGSGRDAPLLGFIPDGRDAGAKSRHRSAHSRHQYLGRACLSLIGPSDRDVNVAALVTLAAAHLAAKIAHEGLRLNTGRLEHRRSQHFGVATPALDLHEVAGTKVFNASVVEYPRGHNRNARPIVMSSIFAIALLPDQSRSSGTIADKSG